MKLNLNGVELLLDPEEEARLLDELLKFALAKYEGLGSMIQSGIKLLVQHKILMPMEAHVTTLYGKETGRQVRPPRGADPVPHAVGLLKPQIREMLSRATLHAKLNEAADCITALAVAVEGQGPGGGPLGPDRGDGIGQDSSAEIPG